jgi:hypothetical protein
MKARGFEMMQPMRFDRWDLELMIEKCGTPG